MLPAYKVAKMNDGSNTFVPCTSVLDTVEQAREYLDKLAVGVPVRTFAIIQGLWGVDGKEIIGWVFVN